MSQRADVHGQGNVTVQIVGEHNQVTVAGAAALRLTMHARRRREGGETGLLSPYTQSIDLVGRKAEMADLKAWLASERDVAIQVRTGKAGTGKTRLAFDLCDELQGGDWQAGFVNGEHLKNLVADAGARWGWDLPTLAVVDYAAEWADPLRRWFGQLADFAPVDAQPLRILLLERQADVQSGWLLTALGTGTSQERIVGEMLDPGETLPVSGLMAPEHRRAVLDGMLTKLQSPIRTPAVGTDPDFDRRLDNLTWGGEPLFLMMAALLAAETSLPQVLELPRTEIAHKVARREIGRIRGLARERGLAPELLVHMASYVTLCQGLARNALLDAIETEAAAFRWGIPAGGATVADALADTLPGTAAAVEPIRPDALGEAVVLQALGDPRIDGTAVVARAYGQAGALVAAFVIRTAQDFAAAGYEQPLAWLDRLVERGEVDLEQLQLLANTLPERSFVLLEPAAHLAKKLAERLQDAVSGGEKHWLLPALAVALSNLGLRLTAMGQRQEALRRTQEAVDIGRRLAAANPDAYEPILASCLNNLGFCLSELGRDEAALGPTEEAVAIQRKLAAANPDAFEPDLMASSLHNLGRSFGKLGRDEAALGPTEEAVAIRRKLAAANPDAFEPDLALSLNNLGKSLSALGQCEAALRLVEEATLLYRKLAAANPDAHEPHLAMSLDSLGVVLSELGRRQAALSPTEEAVEIRRKLAAANPDAYEPDLAMCLSNLGVRLSQLGRREAALGPTEEAVEIRRKLAAANPDAYEPQLGGSLINMGNRLFELGRYEAALGPTEEAALLYRKLAAVNPDAHEPRLAMSLDSLGAVLSELGRRQAALGPTEEAVEIRRKLAAANSDAYEPQLAISLNNLGIRLGELDRRAAALGAAEEAALLYRKLVAASPDAYGPQLAMCLNNLGVRLSQLGRREAALGPAEEAVRTLAPHFLRLPAAYGAWMMNVGQNYLVRCQEVGREPDSDLLGPIVKVLQRMQEGSDGEAS